jgi:hypothetical protein
VIRDTPFTVYLEKHTYSSYGWNIVKLRSHTKKASDI